MRRSASGRPWLFSLDSDHPALRGALEDGGRATTVIDGWMTVLGPGMGSQVLVRMVDVPLTLAGISSHNTQNAMAVASAALGAGLPWRAVVRGLKSFVLDPETNPGRTNLFELDGRVVVVDYAHNEAGLRGLVETCRGLRPPRGEIWIAFGSAGDRTNEIIQGLGSIAARGADHVAIAELRQYLRGRDPDDLVARLRAGALEGGASDAPVFVDEMHALTWMLGASRPGDVVAITALSQREEIFGAMQALGAVALGPARVRKLVRGASRGR
jgi:cyanophycin synthetase